MWPGTAGHLKNRRQNAITRLIEVDPTFDQIDQRHVDSV
jgi:hypothetical protein